MFYQIRALFMFELGAYIADEYELEDAPTRYEKDPAEECDQRRGQKRVPVATAGALRVQTCVVQLYR